MTEEGLCGPLGVIILLDVWNVGLLGFCSYLGGLRLGGRHIESSRNEVPGLES